MNLIVLIGVAGQAGSNWSVSVAGSHGSAKPDFCPYRQGKLVIYISLEDLYPAWVTMLNLKYNERLEKKALN